MTTTTTATTDALAPVPGRARRPDALFLVWGPPGYGPRSRVLAADLGIECHHVVWTTRRGGWIAPFKYVAQAVMTRRLLRQRRPRVVFVQSPPTFAVWCARLGTRRRPHGGYVVDAHSDAFTSPWWTRPAWLRRWLTRGALATIVTGTHVADAIRRDGGRALVVPDIPTPRPTPTVVDLGPGFHVVVVSSFAPDEPLEAIAEAAARLPDVRFHLTGPHDRARDRLPATLPPNLRLTGFVPDDTYLGLLAGAHGVLCLTTRDHTMQRGACEAMAVGTPVVTSRWPLLEEYFDQGCVHVDATGDDIVRGIADLRVRHDELAADIQRLRARRQRDWRSARAQLLALLDHGPPAGP